MALSQLPPLSLYVHTPWCVQKCPYCDFNSHQLRQDIPEEKYIKRLLEDLEQEIPNIWGRNLSSIFIGGGTPSLFSPESYEKLLSGIRALIPFHSDIEITMEANPGSVEAEKFKGFYSAGINRISIGIQSFNNYFLQSLGRVHNANEAETAFQIARESGFNNINIDLMYALPKQTLEQALADLKKAISLQPEHLSWYQLTIEPNTLFYHQPPSLPEDEKIIDMSEQGIDLLAKNNYQRYEVSAFSRSGKSPSAHNLNYWQFGDYLGIGAGAHGKITRADNQTITRKSKKRNPKDYLNNKTSIIENKKIIPAEELPLEFMMNALRLKKGFLIESFYQTTGILIQEINHTIEKAINDNLITKKSNHIVPTTHGYQFLNELLEYFMPENFPNLKQKKQQKITVKNLT